MAVTPPTHHVGAIDCLKVAAFKRGLDINDTCAPEMVIGTLLRQIESILGCIFCADTNMKKKHLQNMGQTVCTTTMITITTFVLADSVSEYLCHHQNHHHHHSNHNNHHHHHHHDNLHHRWSDPSREVAAG